MNNTPEFRDIPDAPIQIPEEPRKNVYTKTHAVFALLALVIGSLWYNMVFSPKYSVFGNCEAVGLTIFTIFFAAFAVLFFTLRDAKINTDAKIVLAALLLYSMRCLLYPTDDYSDAAAITIIVLHVMALLFFRCIGNPNCFDTIVGDTAKAVFVEPFASFHALFASFSAFFKRDGKDDEEDRKKAKKLGVEVGLVLLGLFSSLPILFIVLSLLGSDRFFSTFVGDVQNAISSFFESIDFDLFAYINPISVLVALFIFGAMYSADKRRSEPIAVQTSYEFLPITIVRTIMVVLLAAYALFVVAQIDGFAHMFMGKLPEDTTYAGFARSGFFELCSVACINGAVLYYSELFTQKNEGESRSRLIQYLIVGFTMFLIATAATKMIMYICAYGFTPKRFYTTLFMILLAILFSLTVIKLRNSRFKLSRYSVYITLVWLAVLLMIDYDGLSDVLNAALFNIAS